MSIVNRTLKLTFQYNYVLIAWVSIIHTLCCLSAYSFHGSGFDLLFHETSGLRVANLSVYRPAPAQPKPTQTYRGINCKK